MFTQFLGNYLLQKGIIDQNQLFAAMSRLSQSRLKLGTIAIHEGLMTASEVDECLYVQTREDKRFGEIAIERGYLSPQQVETLINQQTPDYVLLGQILVEDGAFDYAELERIMFDYKNEAEIYDLNLDIENKEAVGRIIEKFFWLSETPKNSTNTMYLELLFNSLIRFIGEDFTPVTPMVLDEYPVNFGVSQVVISKYKHTTLIDTDRDTAVTFASRYAKEEFTGFNEYVIAAMEDFLNLHNGLFIVNMSNQFSEDVKLLPPQVTEEGVLVPENKIIDFPIIYSFGTLHLLISY